MKKYYLTFGQNSPGRDGYEIIYALDELEARKKAVVLYGRQWASLTNEEDWNKSGKHRYFPVGLLGVRK
jgi:hypothetical protein